MQNLQNQNLPNKAQEKRPDDGHETVQEKKSKHSLSNASPRIRPLGLLIAILSIGVIYGIGPLVLPIMLLIINLRGGHLSGASYTNGLDVASVAIGIIVLVLCIMAWRGRPAWSRWALMAVVWIATAAQILALLAPKPSEGMVGGNLSGITQPFMICQFMVYILVPLYITWYMNRAPARAFYRR